LRDFGLLEKIDAFAIPGFSNVDEMWRSPPYDLRDEYTVPFHWGTFSFVVDTNVYKGDIDHLGILFDPPPELKDKIAFIQGGHALFHYALRWLGLPICSGDPQHLQQAADLIRSRLNPERLTNVRTVIPDLVSGRFVASVSWNGDAFRARREKSSLRYAYPREGIWVWSDFLAVPAGTPRRAEAIRLISFLLQPENIALQTNFTFYANMIPASIQWLDPELLEAPEIIGIDAVNFMSAYRCSVYPVMRFIDLFSGLISEQQKNF
jgi:spermidine/putrescine transport system substrate-binding protein